MNYVDLIIVVLEVIGVAVASVSSAFLAIEKKLDLFGIYVLAAITAVGGGISRDLLLGRNPPVFFYSPIYVLAVFIPTTLVIFYIGINNKFKTKIKKNIADNIINILDAIGLGVFSVIGVNIAISMGHADNMFLCVSIGTIAGIGGGVLRDITLTSTPHVLKKEIYAVASIAGCIFYYLTYLYIPKSYSIFIGILIIVIIRIVAILKKLNLRIKKLN